MTKTLTQIIIFFLHVSNLSANQIKQIAKFRVSKFRSYQVTQFPSFQVSEFLSFRVSKFLIFRVSEFPSFRVSEFPSFPVSQFPSFRVSELPSFKVSKFPRGGGREDQWEAWNWSHDLRANERPHKKLHPIHIKSPKKSFLTHWRWKKYL